MHSIGCYSNNHFQSDGEPFNLSALVAGSEGTLFFATEIKLRVHPLPPAQRGVICAHFATLEEALRATEVVMQHDVYACELIDRFIVEGAMRNREQQQNLTFLQGEPEALLLIEVRSDSANDLEQQAAAVTQSLTGAEFGYAFPFFSRRGDRTDLGSAKGRLRSCCQLCGRCQARDLD